MSLRVPAVGVIGAGAVGQAVGAALVSSGLCDRLLMASSSVDQAAALADDLNDMRIGIGSAVRSYPVEVAELRSCLAVVVAVRARFTNTRSTDVRMGGMNANTPALLALAEEFRGYPGTLLVVTNPVDLMTRLVGEAFGSSRVFGLGSSLDTARYRLTLARLLDVPVDAVRGHVIGEHGDGAVVCASSTTVNGAPAAVPLEQVRAELAGRPGRISAGIGRTRYGPAGALVAALRLALGVEDGVTSTGVHPSTTISFDTVRRASSKEMSSHPWPTDSPRRSARKPMVWNREYSRSPSASSRKAPNCAQHRLWPARRLQLHEGLRERKAQQLRERLAAGPKWVDTGKVWTTETGEWLHPDTVSKTFQRICDRIPDLPPINLRDLRHVAATILHASGADIHTIKETLRHSTIKLTSDTYTSLLREVDREAAENAARIVPRARRRAAE